MGRFCLITGARPSPEPHDRDIRILDRVEESGGARPKY
jgi:hypothetical protein